jgi:hypothetical protein
MKNNTMNEAQKSSMLKSIQCLLDINDYRYVGRPFRELTTTIFRTNSGNSLGHEKTINISENALKLGTIKSTISDHKLPLVKIYRQLAENRTSDDDLYNDLCKLIVFVHLTKEEDKHLTKKGRKSDRDADFKYEDYGIKIVQVSRDVAFPKPKTTTSKMP